VASHCPIQADTARAVADALDGVDLGRPARAYFANTTGRRIVDDAARVADDLAQAVRHPVRWYDIVALMPEVGVTATVQVPPGHVLTAIVGRETPDVLSVAVDDIGIAATVRRVRSVAGT
jgi:malonate decarboxylase epsilon subunit